jgi:hypothetical protein
MIAAFRTSSFVIKAEERQPAASPSRRPMSEMRAERHASLEFDDKKRIAHASANLRIGPAQRSFAG